MYENKFLVFLASGNTSLETNQEKRGGEKGFDNQALLTHKLFAVKQVKGLTTQMSEKELDWSNSPTKIRSTVSI